MLTTYRLGTERKSVHCGTGHNLALRSRKDLYRKAKRRNLLLELDFEEGVDEFGSNIIGILRYASIEPDQIIFSYVLKCTNN